MCHLQTQFQCHVFSLLDMNPAGMLIASTEPLQNPGLKIENRHSACQQHDLANLEFPFGVVEDHQVSHMVPGLCGNKNIIIC